MYVKESLSGFREESELGFGSGNAVIGIMWPPDASTGASLGFIVRLKRNRERWDFVDPCVSIVWFLSSSNSTVGTVDRV